MSENTFPVLAKLVSKVQCKPGWTFRLVDENGAMRLVITVPGTDSYNPLRALTVSHCFPTPIATYNEKTWRRWIFEMCRRVENHELGEWFKVGEARPFAPLHGPGEDPYTVHEFRPELDAQTVQDGSVHKDKISVDDWRSVRCYLGLRLTDVARAVGITADRLSRAERGLRPLSATDRRCLERFLQERFEGAFARDIKERIEGQSQKPLSL